RLVIIGRRGWEYENAADMLERCRELKGVVVEYPRCGDDELAALVDHAQALLFPSFVEGYGIPLAEALTRGVPVIASDLPVFHEIAGAIPDYADPLDGPRWAELISNYADPGGALRQRQLQRMHAFTVPTWERHFAIVDAFIKEVLG